MIRVVTCDDHSIVAAGIERILAKTDDFALIASYNTGRELLEGVRDLHPDLAIVDIDLVGESGLDLPPRITEACSATRTIMFSMYSAAGYVKKAKANGARGFVTKACRDEVLIAAMRDVVEGARFVSEHDVSDRRPQHDLPFDTLSPRELDTLRLLALGLTNTEIAQELSVSPRTVESHRASVQRKLGLRTRAELARAARDAGLSL